VGDGLIASYMSGSYWGAEVQWLESKLDKPREWAISDQSVVRDWAQRLIGIIEADIIRAQQREDEGIF